MDRDSKSLDEAPKYLKHGMYIIALIFCAAVTIAVVFAAIGLASSVIDSLSGSR